MEDDSFPQIIFDRETLYLKFLSASNFSLEASLWIENEYCELIIANEIFVRVNLPFERTLNIKKNEKYSFNIPIRHIFKHSLTNSKASTIVFVFLSHYEVKVKNTSSSKVEMSDVHKLYYDESISSYKNINTSEDFFACLNEEKSQNNKDIQKKNQIVLYQKYKTQYIVNGFYRLNINEYQTNVMGSFILDYVNLNSFIKNLINIKPNNILFNINNTQVSFECKGIEPQEVKLEAKLVYKNKNILNESLIDFKSFKKLNCLSKIGKGEGKKKKKIFDNIIFKISGNEYDEPNGLLISTPIPKFYNDYFIFISFIKDTK